MAGLSREEIERYQRQIIIPEIGEEGQKALKSARVFLAGAGGLGSVLSYYMAAAGVGFLKVADKDVVELGNLNRQIIHGTGELGMAKAESAFKRLRNLNPHCMVLPARAEIRRDNVLDLVGDCHIILDGTDNIHTRRLLNFASLKKGIPFICGGINGLNGMATTFIPGETPCFECLFPGGSDKEQNGAVIGPLPGIIASVQSMEAIKVILGLPGGLKGVLLYFYGLEMVFKRIEVEKNPLCSACGKG